MLNDLPADVVTASSVKPLKYKRTVLAYAFVFLLVFNTREHGYVLLPFVHIYHIYNIPIAFNPIIRYIYATIPSIWHAYLFAKCGKSQSPGANTMISYKVGN